jgi:ribosomal-protein-serine acetyltransferase
MSDAEPMYQAIRESIAEISPWLPFAHEDYSISETRDFLKGRPEGWKKDTDYVFGIVDSRDGSYIGTCGLNDIDAVNHRANLGYWIRTSQTRQGVATAATLLLAKWGFMVVKLCRIEILVATGNKRSQRVAEKVGAQREGVLRNRLKIGDDLHDAIMYSLIPGDMLKTG